MMNLLSTTLFKYVPIQLIGSMFLLCVALAGGVKAGDTSAAADPGLATLASKVSASTVQVAEPFTFEMTVTAPIGSKVEFSAIGNSLGNFDVTDQADRADVPSPNDAGQRIWTRRLTLESIVTGDVAIPSLEILIHHNSGSETLKTEVIPIRVTSVLEDRADPVKFRDIQTVVDVAVEPTVTRAWLWWTLGGIGGLTAVALMLVAAAKRRTWMTPDLWAIRALEDLRTSEAMQSSDSETVTENIMTILRDYLELQFDIAAPVQTSQELLQAVKVGNLMSAAMAKRFAELFEIAELARFAGVRLSQAELAKAIDDAQRLIEQTSAELQSLRHAVEHH